MTQPNGGDGTALSLSCGASGLVVELDASRCIVLVARDLQGETRAVYTVTNVARMCEALHEAVSLREALLP
jgi:hypothetical protein